MIADSTYPQFSAEQEDHEKKQKARFQAVTKWYRPAVCRDAAVSGANAAGSR
jgi:hypothetical protein